MTFGLGPAGTGKTWLAVGKAVEALVDKKVKKILLIRPTVEAGEKLGFLPGTLQEKLDPYLIPLYDALEDFLGADKVKFLIENKTIEIAPLAFMRGRTLKDAFILCDEAQNTTVEQIKMLLTRFGENSKAVINGDLSQVDLPRGTKSGLEKVVITLRDIRGIGFHQFESCDIVRHPLVGRIVEAFEAEAA
jgi:phosphate starvation-inducible PhoH-like protein